LSAGRGASAESLGISPEVYAFYGILQRETGDSEENEDPVRLTALAEEVYETVKHEAVIDWTRKEDVQREMRRKIKRRLRITGVDSERLDEITTALIDLARAQMER